MSDISLTASMRSNLLQLQGTAKLMDMTQGRIATGKKVNSALDGPAAFFTAKGLTDKAGDFATLKDSMGQSISAVQAADEAITAITTLVEQAKGLTASAKSATTTAEKTSLAAQYDDIRTQIDRLAGDATYNGTNLVTGRGTLTGGTFSDNSSVAEAAITGLTDFSRVGTDTAEGTYSVTMQQKVEGQTSVSSSTTGRFTSTSVDLDTATNIADSTALSFVVDGTTVGTFTYTDAGNNTVGEFINAVGANLGEGFADVSASLVSNELVITATDGKKLQLTGGASILSELGITHQGYQTGTEVTTALAAVGGNVNVWTEGYSRDTSTTVTVAVSGNDLVITDGTDSTTVAFANFSTGGATGSITTATINDLTVNIAVTGTLTGLTDGNSTTVAKNLASASDRANTTDIVDNTTAVETALAGVSDVSIVGTPVAGTYSIEVQKEVAQVQTIVTGTNTFAATTTDVDTGTNVTDGTSVDFYIDGGLVGQFVYTDAGDNTAAELVTKVSTFADITASHTAGQGIAFTTTAGKVLEIRETVVGANGLLSDLGITAGVQNETTGTEVYNLTSGLGMTGGELYAHVSGYSSDNTTNMTFAISGTDLVITDGTSSTTGTIALSSFNADGVDTVTVGDLTVSLVTSNANLSTNTNPVVAQSRVPVAQVEHFVVGGAFTAGDAGDQLRITIDGTNYDYTTTAGDTTLAGVVAAWEAAHTAALSTAGFTTDDTAGGGALLITANTAGKSFTSAISKLNDTGGDFTVLNNSGGAGSSVANVTEQKTVTVAGTVDAGDVYTATVGGTTVNFTAASGATTVTAVASGLTAAINANTTIAALGTATSALGVVTFTEDGGVGGTSTISATGTNATTSSFGTSGTSTTQTVKKFGAFTTTGDARYKISSNGATETVNINTSSTTAVTASNTAWGNALNLTADDAAVVAGEKSVLTVEDNSGLFQAVVTSNSTTNKINVSASSNTVVSSSNSAWGSTVGFKADDALLVAGQTSSVAVTNTGGTGENDVKVDFNQDATAFINVEAVDIQANGLGINTAVNNWATTSNIDAAIAELNTALTTLRSNAQNLSTNLSVIQTREDFTANYINALTEGSDKLVLADGNEEAANMLMLQTRQQLGIQALSMASQSAQSVLSLFR